MKVTIGVKALNEERHIAAALASAVDAARPYDGEVILADSGSTDRTIEIARQFPIRIVQLVNPAERSCGTGAQLAFQHAKGEYFYILDGDMVLDPDFLAAGIAYLEAHPETAAVGGRVREMNTQSAEYQIRAEKTRNDRNWVPGIVDQLDCGGLYRTHVVRRLGYFADRNLHAFEEFELAARLRSQGWRFARLDAPAIDHFGHTVGGFRLIGQWLRSGYAAAPGEVLRSAIGKPQLSIVLRKLGHIRNGAIVSAWWVALILSLAYSLAMFAPLLAAPVLFLMLRRRSVSLGLYSFAVWNVNAWGLWTGFLRRRQPPEREIASRTLASEPERLPSVPELAPQDRDEAGRPYPRRYASEDQEASRGSVVTIRSGS